MIYGQNKRFHEDQNGVNLQINHSLKQLSSFEVQATRRNAIEKQVNCPNQPLDFVLNVCKILGLLDTGKDKQKLELMIVNLIEQS